MVSTIKYTPKLNAYKMYRIQLGILTLQMVQIINNVINGTKQPPIYDILCANTASFNWVEKAKAKYPQLDNAIITMDNIK